MRIDISLGDFKNFTLGISSVEGEDDNGQFRMITIGFLLIDIEFVMYESKI